MLSCFVQTGAESPTRTEWQPWVSKLLCRVLVQQDIEHDVELHRRLYVVAVDPEKAAGIWHQKRNPFVVDHWQTFVCCDHPDDFIDLQTRRRLKLGSE